MNRIIFRSPYSRLRKEGITADSIITYGKRDWVSQYCQHSTDYEYPSGHHVTIEFKHLLVIDLWLSIIRFEWVTKRKNKCKFKDIEKSLNQS